MEENYDIKYTSEEKKIEGGKSSVTTNNIKEKEEEEKDLLNKFHGEIGSQSKSGHLGGGRGNMEESFSSFGNKEGVAVKAAPSDHTSFLKHVNSDNKNDKPDIPLPKNQPVASANNLPVKEEVPKPSNSQSSLHPANAGHVGSYSNNPNVNTSITKSHKNYEDSTLEGLGSARKISDEDIKNAATLLLEEVTGEVLRNNKLKINAGGLMNGLRKAKDGVAFFGKVKNLFCIIYNIKFFVLFHNKKYQYFSQKTIFIKFRLNTEINYFDF